MKTNQPYPEEFKIEAVKQITERSHRVADVSARIGVSQHSMYKWIKAHSAPASSMDWMQERSIHRSPCSTRACRRVHAGTTSCQMKATLPMRRIPARKTPKRSPWSSGTGRVEPVEYGARAVHFWIFWLEAQILE